MSKAPTRIKEIDRMGERGERREKRKRENEKGKKKQEQQQPQRDRDREEGIARFAFLAPYKAARGADDFDSSLDEASEESRRDFSSPSEIIRVNRRFFKNARDLHYFLSLSCFPAFGHRNENGELFFKVKKRERKKTRETPSFRCVFVGTDLQ